MIIRTRLLLAALTLSVAVPAHAQIGLVDLSEATLEDLMKIKITSASRKEQRLGDVPAGMFVLTQEDIRRSGMSTAVEALRLVPGIQVARVNSNKWAVSSRGGNSLFSNKLLVLVDGRTVYDGQYGGVFWEVQDMLLDDIDRIEVIRGPGGAIWGANAMNGVINIVTKPAGATGGTLVRGGAATLDGIQGAIRYGGGRGAFAYRGYSQWSDHGESRSAGGDDAHDGWRSSQSGFRLDWSTTPNTVTVEGGANFLSSHPLYRQPTGPVPTVAPTVPNSSETQAFNLLGRWTHVRATGASLQVQSFVDVSPRNDTTVQTHQTIADLDVEYHTSVGVRQDLVAGGGYRVLQERVAGGYGFSVSPSEAQEWVVNSFAQDEIAVSRRVALTLGAKVERDSHAGWGVQPTARVMWKMTPAQHVWSAVSRALRTPSLDDRGVRINATSFYGPGGVPVVIAVLGNPGYTTERLLDVEGGYRMQVAKASLDVTGFVGSYAGLQTTEPLVPAREAAPAPAHLLIATQFANLLDATTRGIEVAAHWSPVARWRLDAGFSTFDLTPHVLSASRDANAPSTDGDAPGRQWQARSAFSLTSSLEVDTQVFHTGRLVRVNVAAYTRADALLEWRLSRQLSAALIGQNLLDRQHPEFVSGAVTATEIPRSGGLRLTWRF